MFTRYLPIVRGALVGCLASSAACDCQEAVDTEQHQLGFDNAWRGSTPDPFASGDPVVEGSRFCPRVVQWYEGSTCVPIGVSQEEYFEPCWDAQLEGEARPLDDGCLVLDTPGLVGLDLEPKACDIEADPPPFRPDRVEFDVRALAGLVATPVWELERRAEREGSPGPGGSFPDDWTDPPGTEIRVVEGGAFVPLLGLYDPQTQEPVASESGNPAPSFEVLQGEPIIRTDRPGVELGPGDRVRADWDVAAGTAPGPTLVGVPRSEVADLQLVPVFAAGTGATSWGRPTAVRAVVRAADGSLLRAPGVQWSTDSATLELALPLGDRVWLGTECTEDDPQPRQATVVAMLDGRAASVQLEWVEEVCAEPPRDPFAAQDADFDFFSCACRSQPRSAPPWTAGLLCLLGLGLGVFRRLQLGVYRR